MTEDKPKTLPYTWTQTLQECSITIPIDAHIKSKDVVVDIKKDRLLVKLKQGDNVFINGELHKVVKPSDSFWSIGMCGSFNMNNNIILYYYLFSSIPLPSHTILIPYHSHSQPPLLHSLLVFFVQKLQTTKGTF